MNCSIYNKLGVLVVLFLAAGSAWGDEPTYPSTPVAGVMGLRGDLDEGWIAVRIDFAMNEALAGVMWYNNDSQMTFPQLLVGTGFPSGPGNAEEALVVAENVSGGSSSWTQVTFSEPIAASLGGLYLMFEVPGGANYESPGEGGGPALGYFALQSGSRGWISGDGDEWASLGAGFSFAVAPVLVPYEPGMAVKSLHGEIETILPAIDPYLEVGPNPFNPRTEIRFGLPRAMHARLDIYDVRGRRVVRLVDAVLPAGAHTATWLGCDSQGRSVASGVYFARLRFGSDELTHKLMLVR